MPKCPNCGRDTHRTEDWACEWCGHPLLSGPFKKIPKTYRQLLEERSLQPRSVPEDEPETAAVARVEVKPAPPPAPAAKPKPEPETLSSAKPAAAVKAGVVKKKPAPPPEPEVKAVAESEPVTAPKLVTKTEPIAEAVPAPEPVAVPALKPDPAAGTINATVDELNTAFNSDKAGTNNKLLNQLLKVTGTVDKVFTKDYLDIFYIILVGTRSPTAWPVRCTFSREHNAPLSRLTEGQPAIVQGKYVGYERNVILKDCTLLQ